MKFDLSRPSDAFLIFFCGYWMTRFTMTYTAAPPPHDQEDAMLIAYIAFGTTVFFQLLLAVFKKNKYGNFCQAIAIGIFDSLLPALGAFVAVVGHSITFAILLGMLLFLCNSVTQSPVAGGPCLYGAVAGSIAAGVNLGTHQVALNIFVGTLLGFFCAVGITILFTLAIALFLALVSFWTGSIEMTWHILAD